MGDDDDYAQSMIHPRFSNEYDNCYCFGRQSLESQALGSRKWLNFQVVSRNEYDTLISYSDTLSYISRGKLGVARSYLPHYYTGTGLVDFGGVTLFHIRLL